MVPKKSPNKPKIPKLSIMKPKNDLFIKISNIPKAKHKVPLILVGLVKKVTVLCGPMIKIKPIKNKMLPRAKKPESKKVIIPRRKKMNPPAVKPTPNSDKVSIEIGERNVISQIKLNLPLLRF